MSKISMLWNSAVVFTYIAHEIFYEIIRKGLTMHVRGVDCAVFILLCAQTSPLAAAQFVHAAKCGYFFPTLYASD